MYRYTEESKYHHVVQWLQDTKIPHSQPLNEGQLNKAANTEQWDASLTKYMRSLQCPDELLSEKPMLLEWLLNYAVRLNYNNDVPIEQPCKKSRYGSQISIDFEGKEFLENVTKLANKCNLNSHPSALCLLKAISIVNSRQTSDVDMKESGVTIPLKDLDLGFNTTDNVTETAAKILRLLYVDDLRKLQDDANEAIVRVQTVTANPKTDSKLGKVGRK